MNKTKAALIAFLTLQIAIGVAIFLGVPMILASWASSAALIAGLRQADAARPWPVGGGHMICGLVGIGTILIVRAGIPFSPYWLIAPAVGLSVFGMISAKALHPPAAGNAAIPVISAADPVSFGLAMLFGAIILSLCAAGIDRFERNTK